MAEQRQVLQLEEAERVKNKSARLDQMILALNEKQKALLDIFNEDKREED